MTSLNLLNESSFDSIYVDSILPFSENNISITNVNINGDCNIYTKNEVDDLVSQINNDIDNLDSRMTTVEQDVNNLEDRMTTAEQDINNLEGRMTTAETNIISLDSRQTTTEGNVNSLNNRMTTAEQNITGINNQISTINTNINNIDTRLSTAENDIIVIQSDVTQLETDLSALETKETNDVQNLQNSINNINTSINTINTTLTNLSTELNTVQQDLQNVEGDITTLNNTVTTISNNVTTLNTNLNNLTNQVNSISSTITNIQNDITGINSSINTINNNITNINNSISSIQSSIQSINNSIQSIVTDIQNLTNDLNNFKNSQNSTNNNFQNSINSINSSVSSLQTTVTGLVASVAVIQAQIVGLVASVASNSASITTLQGQVSTLQADSVQQAGQIQALENGYVQLESEMAVEQGHSAWNILQWSAVLGSAIAGVGTTTYLISTNMINEPQNPTNRYFTEARSRASVSALDNTINYDNNTGKFAVNSSLYAPSSTVSSQWSNITNGIEYNNNVNIGGTLKTNTIESVSTSLNIGNNTNTQNVNIACGSGIQTVNIGNNGSTGTTNINIGGVNDTVTISGTLNYIDATNLEVKDNQIVINKGGSSGSGGNSGIYIEEGGNNTAYIKLNGTRDGFSLKSPLQSEITINQSSHNPVTIGTSNGLSLNNQIISLALSTNSTTGALSSSDWTTFNNKQNSLTFSSPIINTNNVISISKSDSSTSGYLSSSDWTTFNNKQNSLTFSSPLNNSSNIISIPQANTSTSGYLSLSDWNTFNNKQNSLTFSGPLNNTSNTISISQANTSTSGYLSSTDWNTFNNKVSSPFTPSAYGSGTNYYLAYPNSISVGTTAKSHSINANSAYFATGFYIQNVHQYYQWASSWRWNGNQESTVFNTANAYVICLDQADGTTEKVRLNNTGLGIDKVPYYKLDVNGDINTLGIYRVNGNQINTDNILEGTTNLYYTNSRARNALSAGTTNVTYNNTTGSISVDGYTKSEVNSLISGSSGWTISGNDIYNANSGNVGIGQSPSGYKLDVSQTFRINDAGSITISSNGDKWGGALTYQNRYAFVFVMNDGVTLVGKIYDNQNIYNVKTVNIPVANPLSVKRDDITYQKRRDAFTGQSGVSRNIHIKWTEYNGSGQIMAIITYFIDIDTNLNLIFTATPDPISVPTTMAWGTNFNIWNFSDMGFTFSGNFSGTSTLTTNYVGTNTSLTFSQGLLTSNQVNVKDKYLVNGSQISTTNVVEGSNQYFTQQRARGSISVGSSNMFYNANLGLLACDGYTQSEITSFLNGKVNKAGDTMTGHLILNNGLNSRLFVGQPFNADFFTLDVAGESIIRSRGATNPNSLLYFQPNSGVLNRYAIGAMDNGDFLVGNAIKMNSSSNTFDINSNILRVNSSDGLTNRLVLNSTGNIGIGTTAPIERLDVNGNIIATGTNRSIYVGGKTDLNFPSTGQDGMRMLYFNSINQGHLDVKGDNLVFRVDNTNGGTERMRITNNGNVGIGNTSPPYLLTLGNSSGTIGQIGLLPGNNQSFWLLRNNGGNFNIHQPGVNLDRLTVNGNGNVGINTNTPNGRFCVNGRGINDSNVPVQMHCNTNAEAWYAINYGNEGTPDYNFLIGCQNGNARLRQVRNFDMIFSTNDAERMRIKNDGNIGINNNTPLTRLHINSNSNGLGAIIIDKPNGIPTDGQRYISYYSRGNARWNIGIDNDEANINSADSIGGNNLHFYSYRNNGNFFGSALTMLRNGNIGLGLTPSLQLDLSTDDARKLTTSTWRVSCDARIKENIQDANLDILYDNIKNLKLKYFKLSEKYVPKTEDRHMVGVIAQELKESGIYPKAVSIQEKRDFVVGKKTVEYEEKDENGTTTIKQKEEDVIESLENFHSVNMDSLYKANLGATQKLIKKVEEQEILIASLMQKIEMLERLVKP
jgi:predicted  nucleic acid-binding Zn-ribbon protein